MYKMKETQFIIYYREPVQISPDDWEIQTKMESFSERTTLKEIREWWQGVFLKNRLLPEMNIQEIEIK